MRRNMTGCEPGGPGAELKGETGDNLSVCLIWDERNYNTNLVLALRRWGKISRDVFLGPKLNYLQATSVFHWTLLNCPVLAGVIITLMLSKLVKRRFRTKIRMKLFYFQDYLSTAWNLDLFTVELFPVPTVTWTTSPDGRNCDGNKVRSMVKLDRGLHIWRRGLSI